MAVTPHKELDVIRVRFIERAQVALRIAICLLASSSIATAQPATDAPLTLEAVIDLAIRNYPGLNESRARSEAATAAIGVAQSAYLPRLDTVLQINRATRNNVFGLLLPQSVIPPISGPVLGTTGYDSVWGAAAGVLLSWDAVDFGVRKANVDIAKRQTDVARAQTALTQLDVSAAAADAYLTVLAADEAVRAAGANVERLQVFADSVRTLVQNQLRPGADDSRATAELALARNQMSLATQNRELARIALASAIGAVGTQITIDGGAVARLPELREAPSPTPDAHPALRADLAAIDTVRARARAIDRAYFPRVSLQGAFSGRGSGAEVPGVSATAPAFGVPNWAVGVAVNVPVFDLFAAHARKRVELQNEAAARARYDQTVQHLNAQEARARALMTAAAEIANNTPLARGAAAEAESRARARYHSGLANITEVAEAQRLLAQAEADNAVARLGVWRALLAAAQARGDLASFLAQLKR